MNLEVLYHDNQMLAVNKPAGLLTQPSGTDKDNLEDRSKVWIKEAKNKPGNVFLHAVHRLDQVVSGIVLFACTDKALSRLNADMRAHRFTKIYHAVVSGEPPQPEGSLRHFLTHDDYRAEVAKEGDPDAKECLLDYKVITPEQQNTSIVGRASLYSESLSPSPLQETTRSRIREARPTTQKNTLLEIQLHTGRYHQIRAQLAAIGRPILGDEKYGSKVKLSGGAIALHHARLTVIHPVSKAEIVIEAPYPEHWPVA
jgi:23S rRNA pseudouridine1911/1915/1917 synthase